MQHQDETYEHIHLKRMKHMKLDTGSELNATKWHRGRRCELIGDTDLGRRM
jgi:hypothetical protein